MRVAEQLLERLLGRLPIGWLQLVHNRGRLAAALGGVAFANLLIFMQLGFLGALVDSIKLPYDGMRADIMISASDMNTLGDGSPLPRQRMYQAQAVEGVADAVAFYSGRIDWKQPDGTVRNLDVFGFEPSQRAFKSVDIEAASSQLTLPDSVLIDRRTRNVSPELFARMGLEKPYSFEVKGRTLNVVGTFEMGGGFSADGFLVTSDQTFLRLFPQRRAGAPNQILVTVKPNAAAANVVRELKKVLPASDTAVRLIAEAAAKEQSFQTTQKPVGFIFGFGVVIGVLVGIVIVYQVLSTDVADHLKEYATFKAVGYPSRFFLGIVFEEALILALLGFIPGCLLSLGLYYLLALKTGLPISMSLIRAISVFVGTVLMCSLSGAVATQRLAKANPADLF